MDPDRVGTSINLTSSEVKYPVSNLYGSRQSRDPVPGWVQPLRIQKIIYKYGSDDLVGLVDTPPSRPSGRQSSGQMIKDHPVTRFKVSNLYGSRQSRDKLTSKMVVRVNNRGFQFIWIPTESGPSDEEKRQLRLTLVSNLYGSRQSRDYRRP